MGGRRWEREMNWICEMYEQRIGDGQRIERQLPMLKHILSFFLFCLFLQKFPNQRPQLAAVVAAEKEIKVSTSITPFFRAYRLSSQTNSWANEGLEHLACHEVYNVLILFSVEFTMCLCAS